MSLRILERLLKGRLLDVSNSVRLFCEGSPAQRFGSACGAVTLDTRSNSGIRLGGGIDRRCHAGKHVSGKTAAPEESADQTTDTSVTIWSGMNCFIFENPPRTLVKSENPLRSSKLAAIIDRYPPAQ